MGMNNNLLEIERKFLIDHKKMPRDLTNFKKSETSQGYIYCNPTIRIRNIDDKYVLNVKSTNKDNFNNVIEGLVRKEFEINIEKTVYDDLLKKCEGLIIYKTRYYIPYEKHTIELDIFKNEYNGLIVAEVEFENVEEAERFLIPNWFLKEITNNKKYTNASLSKGILKF